MAVVVPRLTGLTAEWAGTAIALPPVYWHDVLSDEKWAGGEVAVRDLLRRFPVAVLERQE
jgi:maltooligosyltrehalose synthase